jgi:uncharacterized protein YodC (DUF2158 family)
MEHKPEKPADDFRVGSTVKLKSGGPCMTLADAPGCVEMECWWFVGGRLLKETFHRQCLIASDPDPEIPF